MRYAEIPPELKLRHIRSYGGGPNDWASGLPDGRVLSVAATNARFSGVLRGECAALGLPYFDTSGGFEEALDLAFRSLAFG